MTTVSEEFNSKEFITYFSGQCVPLSSSLYEATAEYNPFTYGAFTINDWKKPGSSTDSVAILVNHKDTAYIAFDAPAAATFSIKGRSSGGSVKAYFKLTDQFGNSYEAADSNGEINMLGGNASATSAKALEYKLGPAGRYTITYDKEMMESAGSAAGELRVYLMTLNGKNDDADPTHVVTFKQGEEELDRIQVPHGAFFPDSASGSG